jgi:hypothetical protein
MTTYAVNYGDQKVGVVEIPHRFSEILAERLVLASLGGANSNGVSE